MTFKRFTRGKKENKAKTFKVVICSAFFLSFIFFSLFFISALPNDAGTSVDFSYATPINYSTVATVNNSDLLGGFPESAFVHVAGDTMTGQLNIEADLNVTGDAIVGTTTSSSDLIIQDGNLLARSTGGVGTALADGSIVIERGGIINDGKGAWDFVVNSDNVDNALFVNGTGDYVYVGGDLGVGITPVRRFHVYHPTGNEVARFESGDATTHISLIDTTTGVGWINKFSDKMELSGTTTPNQGLGIKLSTGDVSVSNGSFNVVGTTNLSGNTIIEGILSADVSSGDVAVFTRSGGANGELNLDFGSQFVNWDTLVSNRIIWKIKGTEKMRLTESDGLGIGTLGDPTHRLNVFGTTNLSGDTIVEGNLDVTGKISGVSDTLPLTLDITNTPGKQFAKFQVLGNTPYATFEIAPNEFVMKSGLVAGKMSLLEQGGEGLTIDSDGNTILSKELNVLGTTNLSGNTLIEGNLTITKDVLTDIPLVNFNQTDVTAGNDRALGRLNYYGDSGGSEVLYGFIDGKINVETTGRGKFIINLRTTGGAYKQHIFTDTSISLVDGLIFTTSSAPFVRLGNIASGQANARTQFEGLVVPTSGHAGISESEGTYQGTGTSSFFGHRIITTMTSGGSGGWKMLEINPTDDVGTGDKYLIWAGINDTEKFSVNKDGSVFINTSNSTDDSLVLQAKQTKNYVNYLKQDGTSLYRALFDGSNFHNYLTENIYWNLGGNIWTFAGAGSRVKYSGGVIQHLDTYLGEGDSNVIIGGFTYANSTTNFTQMRPFQFSTFAFNVTDSKGHTIRSDISIRVKQDSYNHGESVLYFEDDSRNPMFHLNSTDKSAKFYGDVNVTGNITAENVFLPALLSSHTNNTIPVSSAGVFENVTFDHATDEIKRRINHVYNDATNYTFQILDDGVYEITYTMSFEDSAAAPNAHVVTRITNNNVELNGFTIEKDSSKQNADFGLHHSDMVFLSAYDNVSLQFTSDDTTVSLTSHLTYGEHQNTGHLTIKKVAN